MSARIVPTLIDLPSELRGSRVLLRPYRGVDAEQVFAAIDESRDHLRPWVTWVDNNRARSMTSVTTAFAVRRAGYCALNWHSGSSMRSAGDTSVEPGSTIRIGSYAPSRLVTGSECPPLATATQRNRPNCWPISRCPASRRVASCCVAMLVTTPAVVWRSGPGSSWRVGCATLVWRRTAGFGTTSYTPSSLESWTNDRSSERPGWQESCDSDALQVAGGISSSRREQEAIDEIPRSSG